MHARTDRFTSADPEQARRALSDFCCPVTRFQFLSGPGESALSGRCTRFADTAVGQVRLAAPAALRAAQTDRVAVILPVTSTIAWRQPASRGSADGAVALAVNPDTSLQVDRWTPGRVVALTTDASALQHHLERLLGTPLLRDLRLEPSICLAGPGGAAYAELLNNAVADLTEPGPDALWASSLMLPLLREALFTRLLLVAEHPWRERLHAPVASTAPGSLRLALDALHGRPEHPWTVAQLARHAEVSVRTLQRTFHSALGTTPVAYLRQIRLQRAHEDLRRADPTKDSVRAVALRWGFAHLPRFAHHYRRRYGCLPSDTMRGR